MFTSTAIYVWSKSSPGPACLSRWDYCSSEISGALSANQMAAGLPINSYILHPVPSTTGVRASLSALRHGIKAKVNQNDLHLRQILMSGGDCFAYGAGARQKEKGQGDLGKIS